MIQLDGFKLGKIKNVLSKEKLSYIITEKQGIIQYSEEGFKWINPNNYKAQYDNVRSSHLAEDGSLWLSLSKGGYLVFRNGEIQEFLSPAKPAHSSILAISLQGSDDYILYLSQSMLNCKF